MGYREEEIRKLLEDILDGKISEDDLFEDEAFAGEEEKPESEDQSGVQVVVAKDEGEGPEMPDELPILPLRGVVVYPMMWLPLTIGQPRSIRLIDHATLENRIIGVASSKVPEKDEPTPEEVYDVGTAVMVHKLLKAPDGTIRIIVQGIRRIKIGPYTQTEPFLKARVTPAPEIIEDDIEAEALQRNLLELFRKLISLSPNIPEEMEMAAINAESPLHLVYLIAATIKMDLAEAQQILELDSTKEKMKKLTSILNREIEVLELGRKIQSEAQSEM
jgi:ATP-dependent Lon protease